MLISSNTYLTKAQGKDNAQYIMNYFAALGWTKNAISAMLGNMSVESTVNPGLWQGRDEFDMSGGFGLVQWTPATKYIDWAATIGADDYAEYKLIEPQCQRIQWELENNEQWQETQGMSFLQFTQSTNPDLRYLSDRFCWGYERPADPDLVLRGQNSYYWYNLLSYAGANSTKTKIIFMLGKPNIY